MVFNGLSFVSNMTRHRISINGLQENHCEQDDACTHRPRKVSTLVLLGNTRSIYVVEILHSFKNTVSSLD